MATIAWTAPLWAALVLGLAGRSSWSWPRVAAPVVVLGLTLVHALFWTDLRMRAPIVPAIALIAAGAEWPRLRLAGNASENVNESKKEFKIEK